MRRMILGATNRWLAEYRMDGLRFDSVKDVPMDMVQVCVCGGGGGAASGNADSSRIAPVQPCIGCME